MIMDWFGLLVAHLAADYLLQNDWMASNKTNPWPGPMPIKDGYVPPGDEGDEAIRRQGEWRKRKSAWNVGNIACLVHCVIYVLSVWLFSFWWMPWWGLAAVFLTHFPMDRFRLSRLWMENVSGQKGFASIPGLAPWSVIVHDNSIHLLTLYVVALLAGR